MLNLDIISNDELQDVIKRFISGMLPHENYHGECFSDILKTLLQFIHLEEFKLEYRLLIEALIDLNKIQYTYENYTPELTSKVFASLLETSIPDAIKNPELGVEGMLLAEGSDANLLNETVAEQAAQKLYTRAMELYQDCFRLSVDSTTVLNYKPELRKAFLTAVSLDLVNSQVAILQKQLRVNRQTYSGQEDWLLYLSKAYPEIRNRLQDSDDSSVFIVDDLQNTIQVLKTIANAWEPIAGWGIPELDDATPILPYRLVVVVGIENVGKTKFCVDKASNVLLAGKRVTYMVGETKKEKILTDIMINYIWKKYDIIIQPQHFYCPDMCPEDIRKVILMSIEEVISNQSLVLVDAFSYDTVYEDMQTLYDKTKFDFLVIDHSCALRGFVGKGTAKENVDHLALSLRDFKKSNPVSILVSSHPSTTAKEALTRGKPIIDSPTKASQNLSTEADEVFILRTDQTLRKQRLLKLENTKRRDAPVLSQDIYLRTKFEVSGLIYDENEQAIDSIMEIEKQEALDNLTNDLEDVEYSL